MKELNIAGRKPAALAALYNHAKPQGMGFLEFDPKPMTEQEAEETIQFLVSSGGGRLALYFDYHKGRVMKVDLGGDTFDPSLYDRDNGEGAAERALATIEEDKP